MEPLEYSLPTHWASALINNDESGLTDSDIDDLNTFLKSLPPGFHCVDVKDDSGFMHSNDADTLACDVSTFVFLHS